MKKYVVSNPNIFFICSFIDELLSIKKLILQQQQLPLHGIYVIYNTFVIVYCFNSLHETHTPSPHINGIITSSIHMTIFSTSTSNQWNCYYAPRLFYIKIQEKTLN